MKKPIKTVALLLSLICAIPLFAACEKKPDKPERSRYEITATYDEQAKTVAASMSLSYYNASEQLEYTSSDFAIGQFALHACGDEFASWRYFHYARSWKNLYNPQTGWPPPLTHPPGQAITSTK